MALPWLEGDWAPGRVPTPGQTCCSVGSRSVLLCRVCCEGNLYWGPRWCSPHSHSPVSGYLMALTASSQLCEWRCAIGLVRVVYPWDTLKQRAGEILFPDLFCDWGKPLYTVLLPGSPPITLTCFPHSSYSHLLPRKATQQNVMCRFS